MRFKNNYHAHTKRCGHATGTEREYVETAISCGFEEFGFSDHAPYLFPKELNYYSSFRMPVAMTEGYVKTINALKEEYKDKIKIYLGYELEYYPRFFDETYKFLEKLGFDYLILGQHYTYSEVDGIWSSLGTDDESQLENYTSQVIEAMKTGLFIYVAHPDLFKFRGDDKVYEREARRLCEASVMYNVPLEINLLGLRDNRNYPDDRFWRIAGECGVRCILGTDAHSLKCITNVDGIRRGTEIAEKYGLTLLEKPF